MSNNEHLVSVMQIMPSQESANSTYWANSAKKEIYCKEKASADAVSKWLNDMFKLDIEPVYKGTTWVFEVPMAA